MLSERETINKLKEYASIFSIMVKNKEWGKAHNIYRIAMNVTVFLQLSQETIEELFGEYTEGDPYNNDAPLKDGLFSRRDVEKVNLESCIQRNMAYEDVALRQQGHKTEYYGNEDYCARCYAKKEAHR